MPRAVESWGPEEPPRYVEFEGRESQAGGGLPPRSGRQRGSWRLKPGWHQHLSRELLVGRKGEANDRQRDVSGTVHEEQVAQAPWQEARPCDEPAESKQPGFVPACSRCNLLRLRLSGGHLRHCPVRHSRDERLELRLNLAERRRIAASGSHRLERAALPVAAENPTHRRWADPDELGDIIVGVPVFAEANDGAANVRGRKWFRGHCRFDSRTSSGP